jgi:hypothetical protein
LFRECRKIAYKQSGDIGHEAVVYEPKMRKAVSELDSEEVVCEGLGGVLNQAVTGRSLLMLQLRMEFPLLQAVLK